MEKIPTIFERDASFKVEDRPRAGCEWVFDGCGLATEKFDGTNIRLTLRSGQVGSRHLGGCVMVRLYAAGAAARLLVLEWSDHLDAFLGERVSPNLIDVLPGK